MSPETSLGAPLSARDTEHIFESLRRGDVPTRHCEAFAVGIEPQRAEIRRQLQMARSGEGTIKFLRGGYGCGKTFMARLAIQDAQAQGFATSFVVVSDNDLRFHRFDEVYRKVVAELSTASCPRGALGDILDRWIARVESALLEAGADPAAPGFDARVRAEIASSLTALTAGRAPQDFVRAIQVIFDLKQRGDYAEAGALLSWVSGSGNVSAASKRLANIKGDIGSNAALDYLRGVLEITRAAGYAGLLIVIDEAETILRMRTDSRHKSLNGIRQILDASGSYPGLMWLFTGTPELFDTRRGVRGLEPLDARIAFHEQGGFANLRQPQLRLEPFHRDRLLRVALRLRELFPSAKRAELETKVSDTFLGALVDQVTAGFQRDVGVVPRQFLRQLVHVFDTLEQNKDFNPEIYLDEPLPPAEPTERAAPDDDDGPVPFAVNW